MSVRLGPFQLLAPLDAGAMGSIWAGRHLESGTPVAAKLIAPGKLTPKTRGALEREIQTASALDHPGIISIVDQGTVDARASAASEGRIEEGSPYLIMEYCSHTLSSLLPISTWGELRTILASLLDALAYAHARGVVHRDLKPGNVLFGGPEDLRPGLKIADFGIAHAIDSPDPQTGARKLMGTPRYMSPEQVEGDWRQLGPWTDLYSLGALTFKCLHGHGPFQSSGSRLLFDHLRTPAPPLDLPNGFPAELTEWVAWLLEKRPVDRPLSAAAALRALPDGPLHPLIPPSDDEESATIPLATAKLATLPLGSHSNVGDRFLPVPKTWRAKRPYGGSPRLRDVGRTLLGLRPVPLAGREDTRDLLWSAFRQSANRAECVSVLISGQEGLGRTRMLDWLQHRVAELGCGHTLKITGQRRQQRGPVLRKLLAEVFRVGSATDDELQARIEDGHEQLGLEVGPLVGFALHPDADVDLIAAAVAQLLERLSAIGPVLITIDDLHLIPGLLEDMATWRRIQGPVLVVTSAREEKLTDPDLEGLTEQVTFHHVLTPLAPGERQHLIDSILPLSPSLSAQVDQRTAGNPRFAIQLITDWVQQGVLIPGPTGFEAPHDLTMPASLQAIWSSRVRHLLASLPPEAEPVLELAAAMGNTVLSDEIEALLQGDPTLWNTIAAQMSRQRLVNTTPTGIVFSHPAIREVLLHRAQRGERLQGHHGRIAHLLASANDPERVARRGHHRAESGEREGAYADLFEAAQYQRQQAQFKRALVLCDEAEAQLEPGDARIGMVKVLRARTLNSSHQHAAGRQEAEGALELAMANGWREMVPLARLQVAIARYHRGNTAGCRQQLNHALAEFGFRGDPEARAIALNHLAWTFVVEDDLERAQPYFERAARAHFERGDAGLIDGLLILADLASFLEDYEAMEAHLDEAIALASTPPRPLMLGHLKERRVYLALSRERFEQAMILAEDLLDTPGLDGPKAVRAWALKASVHMRLGQDEEAHRLFLKCSQPVSIPESPLERAIIFAGLLATAPDTPSTTLEAWMHAVETGITDPPVTHPTARFVIERAAKRLPPLLAYRCEQLLSSDDED